MAGCFHLTDPAPRRVGEVLKPVRARRPCAEMTMRLDARMFAFVPGADAHGTVGNLPPVKRFTSACCCATSASRAKS
jgi:hypothetical protein